jgi:hypothetical protein
MLWQTSTGVRPVAALIGRRFSRRERTPEELRVWLAFRRASFSYRPVPYDGPVIVLGSRQRNRHFQSGAWSPYLSGTVEGRLAVRQAVRTILMPGRHGFLANAAENSPRRHVGFP